MREMVIFKLAFKNIKKDFKFYAPFLLILMVFVFVFSTLLALARGKMRTITCVLIYAVFCLIKTHFSS